MFVILIFVTILLCGHFKVGAITTLTSHCTPFPSSPKFKPPGMIWKSRGGQQTCFLSQSQGPDFKEMSVQHVDADSLSEQQKANPMTIIIGFPYMSALGLPLGVER